MNFGFNDLKPSMTDVAVRFIASLSFTCIVIISGS